MLPRLLLASLLTLFAGDLAAQSPYQGQIDRWKAQDALNPPPTGGVVFAGSSSIRVWEQLSRDFAAYDTIQRGFGGSTFLDLNQFVDDIVLPYEPAAIVVFEGTNDVASGRSAAQVFNDYLTFVQLVRSGQSQTLPPIPILFIGITPTPARWSLWPVASAVNAMVAAHAGTDPSLYYLDIPTPFLATGQPPAAQLFQADMLHLNQAGYDIWTSVIRPGLAAAVAPPTTRRVNPASPPIGSRVLFDFGPSNPLDGTPTTSPDRFGNHWNNWHAATGGAEIYAGEHIGDLVTTAGTPTGIDLIISGELNSNGKRNGGLIEPSQALLGHLAVGTATQDYVFGNDFALTAGFYLTGLDPRLAYDVRLFGTRDTTETRITRYDLVGRRAATATLQTSGVGIGSVAGRNANDDEVLTFPAFRPDRFGQLFVDLRREAGSYAYLGVLELVVRAPREADAPAPISHP